MAGAGSFGNRVPLITPRKLLEHYREGEKALEEHRRLRKEAYEEMLGRYYPGVGNARKRHLNLIARAVRVLLPHIMTYAPTHEVTAPYGPLELDAEAALFSLYLDAQGKRQRRVQLMRACLQDAFLGPKAIVRCGERVGAEMVTEQGRSFPIGETYQRRVPFERWCCDPSATHRDAMLWESETYDVPRQRLLESGLFRNDVIERLHSTADGEIRNSDQSTRSISWSATSASEREALVDRVTLIDFAIYDEGVTHIVTVPCDDDYYGDFLRIRRHNGVGRGPFEWLEFNPINDQLHGLPPVAEWREQSEAFYTVVEKMVRQIENTKRVLLVARDAPEGEITEVRDSEDGDTLVVEDPTAYQMVELGKTSDQFFSFAEMLMQWANIAQGNTELLSGAGSSTDRATIYEGMRSNASLMVEDYRAASDDFQDHLAEHEAFYAMHNPYRRVPLAYRLPGSEVIELMFDPETLKGTFEQFHFKVRRRSTMGQDPMARINAVMVMLDTIFKAAEVSVASGGLIDVAGVARLTGREANIDRVGEIVRDPIQILIDQTVQARMPQFAAGVPTGTTPGMSPGYTPTRARPDMGNTAGGVNATAPTRPSPQPQGVMRNAPGQGNGRAARPARGQGQRASSQASGGRRPPAPASARG